MKTGLLTCSYSWMRNREVYWTALRDQQWYGKSERELGGGGEEHKWRREVHGPKKETELCKENKACEQYFIRLPHWPNFYKQHRQFQTDPQTPNTRINKRIGINFPAAKHDKLLTNVKLASKPLHHACTLSGAGKSVAGKFRGTFCDDLLAALLSSSQALSL